MSNERQLLPAGAANLKIEIEIEAPVGKTWQTMVGDVGKWWRQDFLICEGSKGMYLDQMVGGKLYEKTDDDGGGFVSGKVISFQPERHLAYVAQIVPPWGGPGAGSGIARSVPGSVTACRMRPRPETMPGVGVTH